ncbi:MAG: phosphoenolpyruvate carboxykinase (ATP) [Elusimicrobia bacterium]|nr:phosphoenolpyruvate carboxykinase (ATP) [Elusimicrobiota bacterium]
MNNYLGIKTPAEAQSKAVKSEYGLANHGLANVNMAYWNLAAPALYEEAIFRNEARMSHLGALLVATGKHTGRSANDKFVVREASSEDHVWWGQYNRPFGPDKFSVLLSRLQGFFQGRDVFVQDCCVGADEQYGLPVRIITEYAWHSFFAKNMFLEPSSHDALRRHVPQFTIICAPSFKARPEIDGTNTETGIILNFDQKLGIICGTAYGGEIKKSAFTVMNYLLPLEGVMPMHCSANIGQGGDTALFFGLSGTGKTTLSADPKRRLIGDDEHGWSEDGIFNFENGCYAKVIKLSAEAEPQIFGAIRRFGVILENVVFDPVTRLLDLDDDALTENTRASYPLSFIENSVPEKRGGHPSNIIFLTCDASGVMPPIARLTPEQAIYHFISGYTAKISATEIDMSKEPEITFSACFGAPFMVHQPAFYAGLLKQKIIKHHVACWLVNTGWTGGSYRTGKRISIRYTRQLLDSALSGKLKGVKYAADPVFGFEVPVECNGVPKEVLDPASFWPDKNEYLQKYRQLASLFAENFKKFKEGCPAEVITAGPKA